MADYFGQFFELSFMETEAERYEHPPYVIKLAGQIYPQRIIRN